MRFLRGGSRGRPAIVFLSALAMVGKAVTACGDDDAGSQLGRTGGDGSGGYAGSGGAGGASASGGSVAASGGASSGGGAAGSGGASSGGVVGNGGRAAGGASASGGTTGTGGKVAGGSGGTGGTRGDCTLETGEDVCSTCVKTKCCAEWLDCGEDVPCSYKSAKDPGEMVCIQSCVVDQMNDTGTADIETCAAQCAEGSVVSPATNALINCIALEEGATQACSAQCFGIEI